MPCVRGVLNLLTQVGTQNIIAVLALAYHIDDVRRVPEMRVLAQNGGTPSRTQQDFLYIKTLARFQTSVWKKPHFKATQAESLPIIISLKGKILLLPHSQQ